MKVILAKTYGFCFGVKRAIEIAEKQQSRDKNCPTFILNEIVHNPQVVADLEKNGIRSVKTLEEIPSGATVIFSAHGVAPAIFAKARKKKLKIIDATCPLVLKVHAIVRKLTKEGYRIIYLGDPRHDEAVGVLGEAPEKIVLVDPKSIDGDWKIIETLNPGKTEKIALITQTTLSSQETQKTLKSLTAKYPQILLYNTICKATTERQEAVVNLVKKVKMIVVVGGKKSANTKRLWEAAQRLGKLAFWVENAGDLQKSWFTKVKSVGIYAGASTPEWVTKEVVGKIKSL